MALRFSNLSTLRNLTSDQIQRLPLLVLYLTDGCNSRCAMCAIWQSPRRNIEMALVKQIVASCQKLRTEMVLLSGGEAMQHPEWPQIAAQFHQAGIKVWLLTNALLLRRQAKEVIQHIDRVTVSLDAATPELYQKIRGVDALNVILEGMQIISSAGVPVSTRTTLMRANFRQMPLIIDTALAAGASSVSFLTVDTHNAHAFGPRFEHDTAIPLAQQPAMNEFGGLAEEDLPEFAVVLDRLEQTHAEHFADGRIEENPTKLRSYYQYFAAPYGSHEFTAPRCNAPHISAVVNVDGQLQPCYFLPASGQVNGQELQEAINSENMLKMRQAYRQGEREECGRCVCPLYRGPRNLLRGF